MNKEFLEQFKKNSEYIKNIKPFNDQIQKLNAEKRVIMEKYDSLIGDIMEKMANIDTPKCNHDIGLRFKLNDYYVEEGYMCLCCGSMLFVYEEDDCLENIIKLDRELSFEELSMLQSSIREKIESILERDPDISIEDLRRIIDEYLNNDKGSKRHF